MGMHKFSDDRQGAPLKHFVASKLLNLLNLLNFVRYLSGAALTIVLETHRWPWPYGPMAGSVCSRAPAGAFHPGRAEQVVCTVGGNTRFRTG